MSVDSTHLGRPSEGDPPVVFSGGSRISTHKWVDTNILFGHFFRMLNEKLKENWAERDGACPLCPLLNPQCYCPGNLISSSFVQMGRIASSAANELLKRNEEPVDIFLYHFCF